MEHNAKLAGSSRRKLMRRRFFLLLLASYISVLILAMAASVIFYRNVEAQMLENANRASMTMLEQLKIDFDNKIEQVNNLSTNIAFNGKLDMLLKGNESAYSYNDLMKDMINYTKIDFIYDYYVYFAEADLIVTGTIKMDPERFYDIIYRYQDRAYEDWHQSLTDDYHFRDYLPAAGLDAYGSQSKQIITYMQSVPVTNRNKVLGQVVILIDESMIREVVDKMKWASGANIYILNKNSDVIFTSGNAPALSDEVRNIMNTSSGIADCKLDYDEVTVSYQTSDKLGWRFVMVTPKNTFLNQINRMKSGRNAFMLLCLLVGSGLAYYQAYRNYRPIKEIGDIVRDEYIHGSLHSLNEYEYIKSSVALAVERKNKLTEAVNAQVPIMRSSYLTKLLKGSPCIIDTEKESLGFLQIEFTSDEFMAVIIEVDGQSGFFKSHSEKEWALARFSVFNIGEELLGKHLKNYCAELDQNRVAFIINIPDEKRDFYCKDEIRGILSVFNEIINNQCSLAAKFGVSTAHYGIVQLRECYDEALKSLEYNAFKGMGSITFFDELAGVDRCYYYPIDMEIQLINFLRSGEYEQAVEMVSTLFDINFKSRRISLDTGRCLIVEMAGTFMKVLNISLIKNNEAIVSIDELVNSITGCGNMDQMLEKIKELTGSICEVVNNQHSNTCGRMADEIMEYVREHYAEPSLSLTSIADNFNITPQYVSMVFKREKSENLKDFISRVKLDKAKEFLTGSSMTMADIAQKLGYSNELGVIRLFKKYEGITPGTYRKNYGLE